MKILFDQGTPAPLRQYLAHHSVDTAFERGWSDWQNGALLSVVAQEGYDLLMTTDQNWRHQQNLTDRPVRHYRAAFYLVATYTIADRDDTSCY